MLDLKLPVVDKFDSCHTPFYLLLPIEWRDGVKTIWKYPLRIEPEQVRSMSASAKILTAQMQNGQLCLWAEVDTDESFVDDFIIQIFGTGHELKCPYGQLKYLATVQHGLLVWHIYERINLEY